MLNIITALLCRPLFFLKLKTMVIKTLEEYATDKTLISLLVKERVKCRKRNRSEKYHKLDKKCDLENLTNNRKKLSRMMPPRYKWVRLSRRAKLPNNAIDTEKNAEKALLLTIKRDRKKQKEGEHFDYLDELDSFVSKIKERVVSGNVALQSPKLIPILKKCVNGKDNKKIVICRPLSIYLKLEDKIILSLTSRYITRYFDKFLHDNILSFRKARDFNGKKGHVTDFNDGIELIKSFHASHMEEPIYVSDCDIKKFYDIIPHQVVRDCFSRMFDSSTLTEEGKTQVMRVLNAYLDSYNFYTNAWQICEQNEGVFHKIRKRLKDRNNQNIYKIEWVDKLFELPEEDYLHRGVPQGGSLSLIVANVVLNDVDRVFTEKDDKNRLFIRFCDDMILMHTDNEECCRLMQKYTDSLTEHGLYYHDFENVADCSKRHFWEIKSHLPFLWGDGEGNSNRYIGFLGYEMRRNGKLRLRKSNIKHFEEKLRRMRYALRRKKKENPENFENYKKDKQEKLINSVRFYTAFTEDDYMQGMQFKYMRKITLKRTLKL